MGSEMGRLPPYSPPDTLQNSSLVITFVRVNKGSARKNKMVVRKASICNLCYIVGSFNDFIQLKVAFYLKCHIQGISCIITEINVTNQPSIKLTEEKSTVWKWELFIADGIICSRLHVGEIIRDRTLLHPSRKPRSENSNQSLPLHLFLPWGI